MGFLNDKALLVEAVKAKSFRGAAEVTSVPNSTLSRRISALEKAIGLRLLHRTTRRIELTEAGLIYGCGWTQLHGESGKWLKCGLAAGRKLLLSVAWSTATPHSPESLPDHDRRRRI
ncbi:transcriptional regulator protein [Rhizobium rhizogenes K84]|uniref:Transcriptional regulator protein n=1 Tax=Rhizobium rhizogenes (strain K84 / ATCC BAA-868) TaxID=311403 RepID=B9JLZ7_RHIR8|nr:transcriptional regulator protein [Rhizobium rhizogenes K84]